MVGSDLASISEVRISSAMQVFLAQQPMEKLDRVSTRDHASSPMMQRLPCVRPEAYNVSLAVCASVGKSLIGISCLVSLAQLKLALGLKESVAGLLQWSHSRPSLSVEARI